MPQFSNKEKAQEARRELGMRRHVYATRVAAGQMRPEQKDRLVALMQEMADEYEERARADEPDLFAGTAPPVAPRSPPCLWRLRDDDYWATSCQRIYAFVDGGAPVVNGFTYCPFCARPALEWQKVPA